MGYFGSPTFGEITFFPDNCVGQNKNRITIWYALWLLYVELFFSCETVYFLFGETQRTLQIFFLINLKIDITREISSHMKSY